MTKRASDQKEQKKVAVARPRAFARSVRQLADRELHRTHAPEEDRSGGDAAPRVVAVIGPKACGKSSIIQALVKHYTHRKLEQVRGPVTVVASKTKRLTLIEVPPELPSMVDAAKIADLALLVINAAAGFEMETFEFLSVAAAHGMPRMLGVLTHLDTFKDPKKCRRTKKLLKDRLASEIVHGAKLFYLSGMREHGEYLKREVHNLARFISVIKYRPIAWRNDHPFVLVDRVEDMTPPSQSSGAKAERHLLVHGFLHGSPLRMPTVFHVPGLGDFSVDEATPRADPIPPPVAEESADGTKAGSKRRRTLQRKERFVYAPMANLDGVFFDPDALYVNIPDAYIRFTPSAQDETAVDAVQAENKNTERASAGELMVRALQDAKHSLHQSVSTIGVRLFGDDRKPLYTAEVGDAPRTGSFGLMEPTQSSRPWETVQSCDASVALDAGHLLVPARIHDDDSIRCSGNSSDDLVYAASDTSMEPSSSLDVKDRGPEEEVDSEPSQVAKRRSKPTRSSDSLAPIVGRNAPISGSANVHVGDVLSASSAENDDLFSARREAKPHGGPSWRNASVDSPMGTDDESEAGNPSDSETSFLARFAGVPRHSSTVQSKDTQVWRQGTDWRDPGLRDSESDVLELDDSPIVDDETNGGHDWRGRDIHSDDSANDHGDHDCETDQLDGELTTVANQVPGALSTWIRGQFAQSAWDDHLPQTSHHVTERAALNEPSDRAAPQTTACATQHGQEAGNVAEGAPPIPEDAALGQSCFVPGTYLRLELRNVPAAFVHHFDPMRPLILGALPLPVERTRTMMRIRLLRHRWFRRLLKTHDPLLFSIGWHRFESVPIFSLEDSTGRHRMLKYTLEHMHCEAMLYGPVLPPGSGVVCFQSLGSERSRDFRVAATGVVCELDHQFRIVKKLKLVGEPHRIFKNTAFIRGMFNSELEVNKFMGALLRTPSGLRGVVKRSVRDGPPGTFRATFEDRLLMSDLVFLRAWVPVTPPSFYHPTRNLLEPAPWASTEPQRTYRWIRTARELRAANQCPVPSRPNSLYQPIERLPRRFHPLRIPRALEAALPFASKPKQVEALNERKRRRLAHASPGLAERAPDTSRAERKEAQLLQMLRTVRRERAAKRGDAEKQKRQIYERQREKDEMQRLAARRARKKLELTRPRTHS
ncbi:hypothetical protein CCYA_CCYA17G4394 [Cyanidiococcus yangmingshanensis]|nr:hypothetical protein CCYA_CCYA17G4394 [Cyanidiococcus yangmingshanensis]